ncbi:MAG: Gfo/Idh/MocA family oxidoreductase [Microbacteriaceae bacterium]
MRQLRVALIGGGGFMGYAHSNAYELATLDTDIPARLVKQVLVEPDAERGATAAERLDWRESATDWRRVIERDDIDIVAIVTPPDSHAEIAIAAMRAGKHVLCEKPLANDADEAEDMWRVATEEGVVNQVGHNYRHTPALGYLKRLLSDGTLGRPLQLRISYLSEGGFDGPMFGWRGRRSTGGSGMSGDLGSHIIDIAVYLMGDIARVSGRLVQDGRVMPAEHTDDLDNAGLFLAEFAEGGLATFSYSVQSWRHYNHIRLELDAETGAAIFDWGARDQIQIALAADDTDAAGFRTVHLGPEHPDSWWRVTGLGTGYLEPAVNQVRRFLRAILDGGSSHPNFGEAAHVQRVVRALDESSSSGRWVEVAPRDRAAIA